MKFILLIGLSDFSNQKVEPGHGPAVDFLKIFGPVRIFFGVIIMKVPEEKTAGVPDFSIGLGKLDNDWGGDPDIVAIIFSRHPEPENFSAILADDFLRGNDVTGRF